MLICTDPSGRKWFTRSEIVPETFWPHNVPGRDTAAHKLHRDPGALPEGPLDVNAGQWIDHPNAMRCKVSEDSRRTSTGLVLTLLWWQDERQILDLDDDQEEEEEEADKMTWH